MCLEGSIFDLIVTKSNVHWATIFDLCSKLRELKDLIYFKKN